MSFPVQNEEIYGRIDGVRSGNGQSALFSTETLHYSSALCAFKAPVGNEIIFLPGTEVQWQGFVENFVMCCDKF